MKNSFSTDIVGDDPKFRGPPASGPSFDSESESDHPLSLSTTTIDLQANGVTIDQENVNYVPFPLGDVITQANGPGANKIIIKSTRGKGIEQFTNDIETNLAEDLPSVFNFDDIGGHIDWVQFDPYEGIVESQTPGLNVCEDFFQSSSARSTEAQAIDRRTTQVAFPSSHEDISGDSDTESNSFGTGSIESQDFDHGTNHAEDLSSYEDIDDVIYGSEPEIFNSAPECIDSAFDEADTGPVEDSPQLEALNGIQDDYNWQHFNYPPPPDCLYPTNNTILDNNHSYEEIHSINPIEYGYLPPTTYIPSPTPQNAVEYFAHLATQPCADRPPSEEDPTSPAYPDHHPENPPRTILTSLPPLPPANDEASQPRSSSPSPPSPPPLIVPASSQFIFTSITTMITKANASRRRAHDFGMPIARTCFGCPLHPSRRFVGLESQPRRRRGPDKGPRKRIARDGDIEGERPAKRICVEDEG
ncbi:MAG: hypothetical protein Q9178_001134 [Gyalolechia marmorata]